MQFVHEAALVVVEKVEPATQAVQAVLAVVVQLLLRKLPAAQVAQFVHEAALVVSEKVVPATQFVQAAFTVAVQAVLREEPAVQFVHQAQGAVPEADQVVPAVQACASAEDASSAASSAAASSEGHEEGEAAGRAMVGWVGDQDLWKRVGAPPASGVHARTQPATSRHSPESRLEQSA